MELPVERLFKVKEIDYRLIELSQEAFTVDDVIRYSMGDINPKETCKTIILKGKKTSQKVGLLLRGKDKIDFSAAKKFLGEEVTVATPEEVKDVAGVEPGAVCPVSLTVPLLVDAYVLVLEKINCGSTDHLQGLEFKTDDLIKLVNYEVINLAKVAE